MANLSQALIASLTHHNRIFELSLRFCEGSHVSDFLHRDYGELTSIFGLAADYSYHDEVFHAEAAPEFQKAQSLLQRYWALMDMPKQHQNSKMALMDTANPADSKSGLAKAEEKQ